MVNPRGRCFSNTMVNRSFLTVVLSLGLLFCKAQVDTLLQSFSGKNIENIKDWEGERRKEILRYYQKEVYGDWIDLNGKIARKSRLMLDEVVTYEQTEVRHLEVIMTFTDNKHPKDSIQIPMTMMLPKSQEIKGVFFSLNFYGNITIDTLSTILFNHSFIPENDKFMIVKNAQSEDSRGTSAWRWPIAAVVSEGYGIATCYAGDFAPDHKRHYKEGILRWLPKARRFRKSAPGCIAAWAWGLSQMKETWLDLKCSEQAPLLVVGHSRLGKAALWAGVNDSGWDAIISNNSGCAGAALFKRPVGEDVYRILIRFPYWFAPRLHHYAKHEERFQLDQQMLLALAAPRPLYVASAIQDTWSDPEGEYLAWCYAQKAYQLYQGKQRECVFPAINAPVLLPDLKMGYHVRKGDHDITLYDWKCFIDFANQIVINK